MHECRWHLCHRDTGVALNSRGRVRQGPLLWPTPSSSGIPKTTKGGPVKPHYRAISRRPVPLAYVKLAIVSLLVLILVWGCAGRDIAVPKGIEQVQHVIVIYMENWSFNG